jgi:DHA2 family methylenomycin A resistance protein-like MFS transporter
VLLTGVIALGGITAGFIVAGEAGWLSPLAGLLVAGGVVAGVSFVLTERRQRDPMLPLSLFRSHAFSAGNGVGVLFNLSLYGSLICLSLFLQQARHESALATGLLLLPMSGAVAAVRKGRPTDWPGTRVAQPQPG